MLMVLNMRGDHRLSMAWCVGPLYKFRVIPFQGVDLVDMGVQNGRLSRLKSLNTGGHENGSGMRTANLGFTWLPRHRILAVW